MRIRRKGEAKVYVLKAERELPEEEQTRFTLKPVSSVDVMDDMIILDTGEGTGGGYRAKEIVRIVQKGLVGWDNLRDENGDNVPFEIYGEGHPTRKTLEFLPMPVLVELSTAITEMSNLSIEKAKN